MNLFRKLSVLLLIALVVMGTSVVFAQKGDSETPEPEGEEETTTTTEEDPTILTLPLLLDGEPTELTLEGTDGGLLAAFNASEGDEVSISMSSEDVDSFILILDESGYPVAYDDDSAGELNSLVEGFEVPFDGTYFILATTFSEWNQPDTSADGVFELMVEGNTQPAGIAEDSFSYQVVTAEVGEIYDVEIGEQAPVYLVEFMGEAGQEVTIDAPSDTLDTLMMLFDMNGNRIAVDDDGGEVSLASHIEAELPETGYYLLLLTTYNFVSIPDGGEISEGIIEFSIQ